MDLAPKSINKAHLAKYVEKELNCSRRNAIRIVNGLLNYVHQSLEAGCKVQLSPLGTFMARLRAGHRGKSPKTGETFLVKARRVVVFKPGKSLRNLRPKT